MIDLLIAAISPMAKLQIDGDTLIINEGIDFKSCAHAVEACEFINATVKGLLKPYSLGSLFAGNRCCT